MVFTSPLVGEVDARSAAGEGTGAGANQGCPHPTLSRTRERGKSARQVWNQRDYFGSMNAATARRPSDASRL